MKYKKLIRIKGLFRSRLINKIRRWLKIPEGKKVERLVWIFFPILMFSSKYHLKNI